jgi:FkbM family methyltransferase
MIAKLRTLGAVVWRFARARLNLGTSEERARRQLFSLRLAPGDIAIDCGANVGKITEQLAQSGATVHAFEPNPHAYAELERRFTGVEHVHCYQKAVSDVSGTLKLYLHERSSEDEIHWSTGSSLLSHKPNVRTDKFVEVEAIDLCDFLGALSGPVKVLKMDVEGSEVAILEKMIDTELVYRITHVFVETHEVKIPELRVPTAALRERIRHLRISHINLDWT